MKFLSITIKKTTITAKTTKLPRYNVILIMVDAIINVNLCQVETWPRNHKIVCYCYKRIYIERIRWKVIALAIVLKLSFYNFSLIPHSGIIKKETLFLPKFPISLIKNNFPFTTIQTATIYKLYSQSHKNS